MPNYYIEIDKQDKFRQRLLLAQKTLVGCLGRCESFKTTRQKKLDEMKNLTKIMCEIVELSKAFEGYLPKVKVKVKEKEVARKSKSETVYDYSKELRSLETSINAIETKLNNMKS